MISTFGEKIKSLRKDHGWSQDKLGLEVGLHGRHIGKYETGRAMPNAETLVRIANALKVSIDYLLRNGMEENPTSSNILRDPDLIRKFEAVEKMNKDDKRVVTSLIDAYIKKQQIEDVLHQ